MYILLKAVWQFASTAKTACPQGSNSCDTGLPIIGAGPSELHQILQLTLGVLAALAVLFVVIGGLRFVMSEGDPQATTKARNTMIYALVGLIVAIAAEGLVTFVLKRL